MAARILHFVTWPWVQFGKRDWGYPFQQCPLHVLWSQSPGTGGAPLFNCTWSIPSVTMHQCGQLRVALIRSDVYWRSWVSIQGQGAEGVAWRWGGGGIRRTSVGDRWYSSPALHQYQKNGKNVDRLHVPRGGSHNEAVAWEGAYTVFS